MIVDWYYPTESDNFTAPWLYLRTRDKNGTLQEEHISPEDDKYVKPHCWIPVDTPNWKINRMLNRHASAVLHQDIRATGITLTKFYYNYTRTNYRSSNLVDGILIWNGIAKKTSLRLWL